MPPCSSLAAEVTLWIDCLWIAYSDARIGTCASVYSPSVFNRLFYCWSLTRFKKLSILSLLPSNLNFLIFFWLTLVDVCVWLISFFRCILLLLDLELLLRVLVCWMFRDAMEFLVVYVNRYLAYSGTPWEAVTSSDLFALFCVLKYAFLGEPQDTACSCNLLTSFSSWYSGGYIEFLAVTDWPC